MLSPHYFHVKLHTAKGEIIQKTFEHQGVRARGFNSVAPGPVGVGI
jgi:hypothetical protein